MVLKDSNGRECEVEFEFNGDGSAYIESGVYLDTGAEVEDVELDWMNDEYPDACDSASFGRALMQAEAWFEGDR